MDEVWRPVPFDSRYQVSSLGRVKSFARSRRGIILKPKTLEGGYKNLRIGDNGFHLVHRLVLMAFVGECPAGMEGCHKDGDPQNNAVENLRWDTRSANAIDRVNHGRHIRNSPTPKLTPETVQSIRAHGGELTVKQVANVFSISSRQVRKIRNNHQWKGKAA